MKSMTGFGFGEGQTSQFSYAIELKSYNNRYLDLILQLPPALSPREPQIREWISTLVGRGRVEFTVRVKERAENVRVQVNEAALAEYLSALNKVKKEARLGGKVTLDQLIHFEGLFQLEKTGTPSDLWEQMKTVWEKGATDFVASREREGGKTHQDILRQLQVVLDGRSVIGSRAGEMENLFRENLKKRFAELMAEVDENRLHAETALLLIRYGINEELVRLESHLTAFQELTQHRESVGKKLDFLCQEIGREINTIGSKTTLAEVQQIVVGMKDAMENIREQLRNVE